MRRGLRLKRVVVGQKRVLGCSERPDEKGLRRSAACHLAVNRMMKVGMSAPMRRGLRPCNFNLRADWSRCWNECPDEKGIETIHHFSVVYVQGSRWNECPD